MIQIGKGYYNQQEIIAFWTEVKEGERPGTKRYELNVQFKQPTFQTNEHGVLCIPCGSEDESMERMYNYFGSMLQ